MIPPFFVVTRATCRRRGWSLKESFCVGGTIFVRQRQDVDQRSPQAALSVILMSLIHHSTPPFQIWFNNLKESV
jgi:hypothetical protein